LKKGVVAALLALLVGPVAAQNCVWTHIDHRVPLNESGAWNPVVYRGLSGAMTVANAAGAVIEGADSRVGKMMWEGIDSEIISAAAATAGKYIFTRVRPSTEDNPCLWFQGGSNPTFPSGEAAVAAGLITPFVIEYARDQPLTYLLLLLPAYVGAGRIKNQAHWQSDVLAGRAVGGLSGWYAHSLTVPLTVRVLARGATVGVHFDF
jgi:membrane-associated phospholipid phosphatase